MSDGSTRTGELNILNDVSDRPAFSQVGLQKMQQAMFRAQSITGYDFRSYIGPLPEGRASAVAVQRSLPDPDRTVLVAVDPEKRALEIVTGRIAAEYINDSTWHLASLSMTSRFALGDIAAGIRDGVNVIAEHARSDRIQVYHTDLPA